MALTAQQTRQLKRAEDDLAECDYVIKVTTGLGAASSSQGVSASYSSEQIKRAHSMRPVLRRFVDSLEALRDGEPLPPAPGVTVTRYVPTCND